MSKTLTTADNSLQEQFLPKCLSISPERIFTGAFWHPWPGCYLLQAGELPTELVRSSFRSATAVIATFLTATAKLSAWHPLHVPSALSGGPGRCSSGGDFRSELRMPGFWTPAPVRQHSTREKRKCHRNLVGQHRPGTSVQKAEPGKRE